MEEELLYTTMMMLSLMRIGLTLVKTQARQEISLKPGMFKIIILKIIVVPMVKTFMQEAFLAPLMLVVVFLKILTVNKVQ